MFRPKALVLVGALVCFAVMAVGSNTVFAKDKALKKANKALKGMKALKEQVADHEGRITELESQTPGAVKVYDSSEPPQCLGILVDQVSNGVRLYVPSLDAVTHLIEYLEISPQRLLFEYGNLWGSPRLFYDGTDKPYVLDPREVWNFYDCNSGENRFYVGIGKAQAVSVVKYEMIMRQIAQSRNMIPLNRCPCLKLSRWSFPSPFLSPCRSGLYMNSQFVKEPGRVRNGKNTSEIHACEC